MTVVAASSGSKKFMRRMLDMNSDEQLAGRVAWRCRNQRVKSAATQNS